MVNKGKLRDSIHAQCKWTLLNEILVLKGKTRKSEYGKKLAKKPGKELAKIYKRLKYD